jgi:hypothetical protein
MTVSIHIDRNALREDIQKVRDALDELEDSLLENLHDISILEDVFGVVHFVNGMIDRIDMNARNR